jgi:anion-transporting  ArsA/GET3 family ATPase
MRGARLKARFAVKGIHSSSSDGEVSASAATEERDGAVGIDVVVMGTPPDVGTTNLLRLSDDVNMRAKGWIGEDAPK